MEVSSVAIQQWRNLCKRGKSKQDEAIIYKIIRAVELGKKTKQLINSKIIRYFNINLLVGSDGEVMTLWKYSDTWIRFVPWKIKQRYDLLHNSSG